MPCVCRCLRGQKREGIGSPGAAGVPGGWKPATPVEQHKTAGRRESTSLNDISM